MYKQSVLSTVLKVRALLTCVLFLAVLQACGGGSSGGGSGTQAGSEISGNDGASLSDEVAGGNTSGSQSGTDTNGVVSDTADTAGSTVDPVDDNSGATNGDTAGTTSEDLPDGSSGSDGSDNSTGQTTQSISQLASGVNAVLLAHTESVLQAEGQTKRFDGISAVATHASGLVAWVATNKLNSGSAASAEVYAGPLAAPQRIVGDDTNIVGLPEVYGISDVVNLSLAADGSVAFTALVGVRRESRDGDAVSGTKPVLIVADANGARVSQTIFSEDTDNVFVSEFSRAVSLSHSIAGTLYKDTSISKNTLRRRLGNGDDVALDTGSDGESGLQLDGCPIVTNARFGPPVMRLFQDGDAVMEVGFESRGLTDCPGINKYAIVRLNENALQSLVLDGTDVVGAPGYKHSEIKLESILDDGGIVFRSYIQTQDERGLVVDKRISWWHRTAGGEFNLIFLDGESLPFSLAPFAPEFPRQPGGGSTAYSSTVYPSNFSFGADGSAAMWIGDFGSGSNNIGESTATGENYLNPGSVIDLILNRQLAVFKAQPHTGQPYTAIDMPGLSAFELVAQSVPSSTSSGFGISLQDVPSVGDVIGFDVSPVISQLGHAYIDSSKATVFYAGLYDTVTSQSLGDYLLRQETDGRLRPLIAPLDRIDANGLSILLRTLFPPNFPAFDNDAGRIEFFDDGSMLLVQSNGLLLLKDLE